MVYIDTELGFTCVDLHPQTWFYPRPVSRLLQCVPPSSEPCCQGGKAMPSLYIPHLGQPAYQILQRCFEDLQELLSLLQLSVHCW